MTPTTSSPPPSPRAPTLQLTSLSRILIWNARRREKPAAPQAEPVQEAAASDASTTTSRIKPHRIECSSGSELKTHGNIMDCNPECKQSEVIVHRDVFICLNGVDTSRLLFLSRRRVFEKVETLGGNAIINERWSCTICKQHTRQGDVYKVSINYQGTPARCSQRDPQRPVAIAEVKGVPGLMTIMSRQ